MILCHKSWNSKLTEDQRWKAVELARIGWRLFEIAKHFGISGSAVKKILARRGARCINNRIQSKREDYFSVIDSTDKAYFLGLLSADGYNCVAKGRLEIALAQIDKAILERLSLILIGEIRLGLRRFRAKHPIWSDQYRFGLNSRQLSDDLVRFGCGGDKPRFLRWPFLSKELIWHYVRGYFDGDGCVQYKKNGNGVSYLRVDITATHDWLDGFERFSDIKIYRQERGPIIVGVFQRFEHVERFYDNIYHDCQDLFLPRKRNIFLRFLDK